MFDIKDKVAIVTGGASGIGLATVEMILAKGGKPVIADYNEESGKKEAEQQKPSCQKTLIFFQFFQ